MSKVADRPRPEEGQDDPDHLPRSLYIPNDDPRGDLRETVNSILSDRFMAFLSVLLIPVVVIPLIPKVSSSVVDFCDICDGAILVLFIAEYASKLYLAKDRWKHFKEPWHIVDLIIVVLPFVQYFPLVDIGIKGTPSLLLRLLRLPRALAISGRLAGSRMRGDEAKTEAVEAQPETVIQVLAPDMRTLETGLTWDELAKRLASPAQEWINICSISEKGLSTLSALLRVSEPHFKRKVVDEIYPHIDYVQQSSFIFLQSGSVRYPEHPGHYLTISRSGIILICNGTKIITVSLHDIDLVKKVTELVSTHPESGGFLVSVLYAILESMLVEYRAILDEIEIEGIRIGSTPRSKLPKDFLERMYQLNKEVSRLISNIVHFKTLLSTIISRRVPLEGFNAEAESDFAVLQDDAAYLNEIADDLIDNLKSIIDLYINQTSFETNKILKILAVITAVSVIPAAVGGILGMNLLDVPYEAVLWQVILIIGISMTMVTYVFIKLGWLKS